MKMPTIQFCKFYEVLGRKKSNQVITPIFRCSKTYEGILFNVHLVKPPPTYDLLPISIAVNLYADVYGLLIRRMDDAFNKTFKLTSVTLIADIQTFDGPESTSFCLTNDMSDVLHAEYFDGYTKLRSANLDDSTEIRLILTLEKVKGITDVTCTCPPIPPFYVRDGVSLSKYFLSSKFSDFEISVDGRIFPCHRVVLAAHSPVFAQMFEHPTKEAAEGRVQIEDMSPETMEEVLRFLYTGTCDGLERNDMEAVVALHQVADRYFMEQLRVRCSTLKAVDKGGITEDNAAALWEQAQFYNLDEVKQAVKDFCWENADLVRSEGSPLRALVKKCFPHFCCPESIDCSFCKPSST